MTDRYTAFVVVMKEPIREDDAKESILPALRMLKGVARVEPHIGDYSDEETGALREQQRLSELMTGWLDDVWRRKR